MGYRRERKVYQLRFADEDMAGLVVRARSVPLGQFMDLTAMAGGAGDGKVSADDIKGVIGLFAGFAEALIDWNIEDEDGTPVPATLEGVRSQDADFMLAVVMAWLEAIGDVSAPLGRTSSGGGPSLEASIPMVPLSPSLAS